MKFFAFLACVAFLNARIHLGIRQSAEAFGRTQHITTLSNRFEERSAPTSAARNSPASIAVLASRTYSNIAASASAVFRSSSRLWSKCSRAARVRVDHGRVRSFRKFVGLEPQLEIPKPLDGSRRRFKPSIVKLSFLRYGTEISR